MATFLWRKSPRASICTFIYDNDSIEMISEPKISFFSHKLFSFRKEAKKIINSFISELEKLSSDNKEPIVIEYKIVFNVISVPG